MSKAENPDQQPQPTPEGEEPRPLFPMGQILATPGAIRTLQEAGQDPTELLTRHVTGDWGDLEEEDKKENEFSLREGFRIISAYTLENGERLWIITEADRGATTLLLPSEY